MLIPDRKIALGKIRDTVAEIVAESAGNEKLASQAGWIAACVGQLLIVEDREACLKHSREGCLLLQEGIHLCRSMPGEPCRPESISAPPDFASIDAIRLTTSNLVQSLAQVAHALRGAPSETTVGYLNRVVDWENALYRRLAPPPTPAPSAPVLNADSLQDYLRHKFPERPNLTVSAFKILYGGFSKETTLFSIKDDSGAADSLVLRAEKKSKLVFLGGTAITREFACVRYLHRRGLPVAEPLWVESDPSRLGAPFMVSRRAQGRAVGPGIAGMESLPRLTQESLLATLAKIHQIPVDRGDPDFRASHLPAWTEYTTLRQNTCAWISYWKAQLDRAGCPSTPIVERTHDWLIENVPPDDVSPVMLHGDYGLANILIDRDIVSTVLDWELSFYGDPAYDFTNFMHDYDPALLDLYERAGGQHISEYRYVYNLIFKVMKAIPEIIGLHQLEVDPDAHLNFYLLGSYIHYMTAPLNQLLKRAQSLRTRA